MSGCTASADCENPSGGSVTRPNWRPTSSSTRSFTERGSNFSGDGPGSEIPVVGARRERAGAVGLASEQAASAAAHNARYISRIEPLAEEVGCEITVHDRMNRSDRKRGPRRESDRARANVPRARALGMFCILDRWDSIDVGIEQSATCRITPRRILSVRLDRERRWSV